MHYSYHSPLRLDEDNVKAQTVSITKLDVALNNAIVRAKISGWTMILVDVFLLLSLSLSSSVLLSLDCKLN
jgi:hypothetical protein